MKEHKSFVVYQASAGSGKTYTLAKEYIKLCLSYYPQDMRLYRKIVGITFTNKAVSEMKERILLFFEQLSYGENPHLLSELSQDVDASEIPLRSKAILNLIQHDYSNFSIYTIDSLFQRIVKSFAMDLKIPINHQLELDTNEMMSRIVDLLLSKLGYDKDVTEAILDFSFSNIDDERNWQIERELASIGKQIYHETAIPYLRKLRNIRLNDFKTIISNINKQIAVMENRIKETAERACNAIHEKDIQFVDFYQGERGIGRWFDKLTTKDYSALSGNSYVRKAAEEQLWYSASCKNKAAIESIIYLLQECYETISAMEQAYRLLQAVRKNSYPVALLNEMKCTAEELKRTDKIMHISEANTVIAENIQNEPVPFIYERIGERYKYIFIDEFQDTSRLQWQNLLPLVIEAMSSSLFENETGEAIIFGDAKQAIYRFRGGDVHQFMALPTIHPTEQAAQQNRILQERERILTYNYEKKFLQKNYRSKKEIVEFNNTFFEYLTADEDEKIKEIYLNCTQEFSEENSGGAVFLSYRNKEENETISYTEFVFAEIVRIIQETQQANYTYSDLVVLVRGNEFGAEIARYLLQQNIPTISGESLLLAKNREVNFLIAVLLYVTDTENDIAAAVILDFVAQEHRLPNAELLMESRNKVQFLNRLHQLHYNLDIDRLRKQNLYEQIESLAQIFNLTQQPNPFILAFLDIVAAFVETPGKTEAQFLNYWKNNEHKFSLSNPKGINAVTVMSIHQAKGLEFPIVIYPHKKQMNRMGETWVDLEPPIGLLSTTLLKISDMKGICYNQRYEEELTMLAIDELNVDYVACTRAKDRLYFIAQQGDKRGEALHAFLQDQKQLLPLASEDKTIAYYCLGNPQPKSVERTDAVQAENSIKQYVSKPLAARFSTAKHRGFLDEDIMLPATAWGTKVHHYLSKIYKREDIERVIEVIGQNENGDTSLKENLTTVLRNLFAHPQSDLLLGDGKSNIKNEVEVVDTAGNTFRIDRLRIDGVQCVLFDYKTGAPSSEHALQTGRYEDIVSQMGFEVTANYIIYIDDHYQVRFQS
jgi:ATP-dependent exoDNAse (exonuclease V) beta subunit